MADNVLLTTAYGVTGRWLTPTDIQQVRNITVPPPQHVSDAGNDDVDESIDHIQATTRRHLPPIRLQQKPRASYTNLVAFFVVAALVGIVGTVAYMLPTYKIPQVPSSTDCKDDPTSAAEAHFHINIRVAENLTFARAKIIDLTWDVLIGQGGRLLHAWLFYHVAMRALTVMMERSPVPYYLPFGIMFSSNSLSSLWLSISALTRAQPIINIVCTILLASGIIHVLIFSTVWSAATGYSSSSTATYVMPDGSLVTEDSDSLRICWSVETGRLGGVLSESGVIMGPLFRNYPACGKTPLKWDRFNNLSMSSDTFSDFHAYAITKSAVKKSIVDGLDFSASSVPEQYKWGDIDAPCNVSSWGVRVEGHDIDVIGCKPSSQKDLLLPNVLEFPNLPLGPSDQRQVTNNFTRSWDASKINMLQQMPFYHVFHGNHTVAPGQKTIPYNSTIWYSGTSISLDAPFLDITKDCYSWFPSDLGECVCYNGAPIPSHFNVKDNFVCGNGSGYVWGFSNFITWIGLILEVVWVSVCFSIWIYGERSQLIAHNRPSTGTVRNVLDLAEAVNTQLGNSTSAYGDERLRKELGDDLRFGYITTTPESRFPSRACISLVAVKEGSRARRRMRLDFETEYG